MLGTLYIVATPIGNLQDMTFRAVEVLKNSDYVLAESSARTSKLLSEYNINKRIVTFNKDNEKRKRSSILQDLSEGMSISLVSDAGTPSLSDPGFELVKEIGSSFKVIPIPGASSLTTALSVSKIPINNFMFLGFLSKKSSERKMQLLKIKTLSMPGIIFESKHRVISVLSDITDILGGDTNIGIMRELTKIHEEILKPLGKSLKGIRLDSGDLAYLSKQARIMLDEAGLVDSVTFVTGETPDDVRQGVDATAQKNGFATLWPQQDQVILSPAGGS